MHERGRQANVPKADHGAQVVQGHTQAGFVVHLHAQGVVVQPQVGFRCGEVQGVEELHGVAFRRAVGSKPLCVRVKQRGTGRGHTGMGSVGLATVYQ